MPHRIARTSVPVAFLGLLVLFLPALLCKAQDASSSASLASSPSLPSKLPAPGVVPISPLNDPAIQRKQIRDIFVHHYPAVVGISPDGSKLLLKSVYADRFLLQIVNTKTGNITTINSDPDGQFSPQWSHDKSSVAYFLDPEGKQNFQLQITDSRSKRTSVVKTERIISPRLQWSESDRYVALLSEQRHLFVIDLRDHGKIVYRTREQLSQRANFVWSKKSDAIAFVTASEPQKIQIQNISSGRNTTISTLGAVLQMCWLEGRDTIVANIVSGGSVTIKEFNGDSATTLPISVSGEIISILTTADNSKLVFGLNAGAIYRYAIFDRSRKSLLYGNGSVLGADPRGHHIYISTSSGSKTTVAALNLANDTSRTLFQQSTSQPLHNTFREIVIPIGSRNVPAIIWETQKPNAPAILMIHGGPQLNYMGGWRADVETFLKNGISVALLNYGGSTGYGETFIAESNFALGDVVGAIDFLASQKRYSKLFLLGDSYGSRIAVQATSLRIEKVDGLITYSYFGELSETSPKPQNVLAFQGENDFLCSPECAKSNLQKYWKTQRSDWLVVMQREGHSFRRLDTWADVLARILYFIDTSTHRQTLGNPVDQ